MTTRTLGVIAIVLWIPLAAAFGWVLLRSYSSPAPDGRTVLDLTVSEQEFVLTQMRGVLSNVQGIVDGLSSGNREQAVVAARANGRSAMTAEVALMGKLPAPFQQLNLQLHNGFDEFAAAAEANAKDEELLRQLSGLMGTCVACHAAYRVLPIGGQ